MIKLMLRRILFFVLMTTWVGIAFMPSKAYAQRFCAFEQPKLIVKMAKKPTYYIRSKSARDLTEMHLGRESGNSRILGLGGGELWYKLEMKHESMSRGGRACTGIKAVKVTFYGIPQVHIASNFKRGTCEYRAVLEHEQKHIRTMLRFMREYAPKFKKQAKRIRNSTRYQIGPIPEYKIEDAQQELYNLYDQQLTNYMVSIYPVLRSRQQAVDTPEEYARVHAKCKNWGKY